MPVPETAQVTISYNEYQRLLAIEAKFDTISIDFKHAVRKELTSFVETFEKVLASPFDFKNKSQLIGTMMQVAKVSGVV